MADKIARYRLMSLGRQYFVEVSGSFEVVGNDSTEHRCDTARLLVVTGGIHQRNI